MKPSNELFKLIKSLSKSEKRFFKLSSSLQSGDKNYLKIFDFIDKQKKYDEDSLKQEFLGTTFINHLPSEKNHLYKLILKSLRSYYSEQTISSILKQEIKNVEILYKKALYKECGKFVKRAKKMAEEHEKFYYWFELLSWEKRLMAEAFESGDFTVDLDKLIKEEEEVIAKLRNLAEYQILYSKINYVFRSGGFTRNESERQVVEEIANYHLIKGKNTALSTRAASICYYIKGLCSATNRNYQESFTFFNKVRLILDNNKKLKADLSQRYVTTLSHLLNCYLDDSNFEEAEKLIHELRGIHTQKGFNSMDIRVKLFTSSNNAEILMNNKQGEFEKSFELINSIGDTIQDYGEKIPKEQHLMFTYNMAYTYFGIGDYKKSLSFINELLNDNEQKLRQDIYSFARLFNLLIHYELGNYDFLEYSIKSTSRYLSKYEKDYQIESVFVRQIRKLAKEGESTRLDSLNAIKSEIQKLYEDPAERVIQDYFNVEAWIDGKIKGISFDQAVKEYISARK